MGKIGKRENNFIFIPELFVLLFADDCIIDNEHIEKKQSFQAQDINLNQRLWEENQVLQRQLWEKWND